MKGQHVAMASDQAHISVAEREQNGPAKLATELDVEAKQARFGLAPGTNPEAQETRADRRCAVVSIDSDHADVATAKSARDRERGCGHPHHDGGGPGVVQHSTPGVDAVTTPLAREILRTLDPSGAVPPALSVGRVARWLRSHDAQRDSRDVVALVGLADSGEGVGLD